MSLPAERPERPQRPPEPAAVPRLASLDETVARLEREIARARRDHVPLALLAVALGPVVALDGQPAATHAQALGTQFTHRLRARLRGSDRVWQCADDEWLALLPGCEPAAARRVAPRLAQALGAPYALGPGLLRTRPRVGVASLRVDGDHAVALLTAAQALLDFDESCVGDLRD